MHTVRNLTPDDIDRAVEIVEEVNPAPTLKDMSFVFRRIITNSFDEKCGASFPTFVGVDVDGQLQSVAGYAYANFSDMVWELCWGSVAEKYQGQGIGKAMLDFRLAEMKRRSDQGKEIYAIIEAKPTALYLDRGFEKIRPLGNIGKWLMINQLR